MQLTREFLHQAYVVDERSPADIARQCGTYPNAVRRALVGFGIELRGRGPAQRAALRKGKPHPTKGRPRSHAVRQKIAEGIARTFAAEPAESRKARADAARARWAALPQAERDRFFREGRRAAARAARAGSRLERELAEGLRAAGFRVARRELGADILLPDQMAAVLVDGPAHWRPVYGPGQLAEQQQLDARRDAALWAAGFSVLTVRRGDRTTGVVVRDLLTRLIPFIESKDQVREVL
jgi:very-short-patch-repair endonuclease